MDSDEKNGGRGKREGRARPPLELRGASYIGRQVASIGSSRFSSSISIHHQTNILGSRIFSIPLPSPFERGSLRPKRSGGGRRRARHVCLSQSTITYPLMLTTLGSRSPYCGLFLRRLIMSAPLRQSKAPEPSRKRPRVGPRPVTPPTFAPFDVLERPFGSFEAEVLFRDECEPEESVEWRRDVWADPYGSSPCSLDSSSHSAR